ncbi:MAG: ATP-grasp domain-containing protein [Ignavibacteriales bacterium]|nr:ATP-grasp domain-containing protein [Ignavibacteriales bacterium]
MRKKIHVAVVFNEPTVETEQGRKYISESGRLEAGATQAEVLSSLPSSAVDMSEVGVLEERAHVEEALKKAGFRTSMFNVNGDIKRLIHFIEDKDPDLVFNVCESVGNDAAHEMHVAGIFELLEVPYTGAPAFSLGTCLNKVRTKEILSHHKLPTPKFAVFRNANDVALEDMRLEFPVIVKPSREDASVGIEHASVVDNESALKKRVRYIFQNFDQPALVEEFIEGRELNVGILGNRRPIVLPVSEIDFSKMPANHAKIVTYNAKWMKGTEEYAGTVGVCPADLASDVEKKVKELALKAYKLMGLRDYGRIDIRLTKNNSPFILEVNPNPDISDDAGFARSARAYGLSFEDTITKIVEYALERRP